MSTDAAQALHSNLGDLLALASHPSQANWRAICAMLDQWGSPHLADAVLANEIEPLLERWPRGMRPAPRRWLMALAAQKHIAGLHLADHLVIRGQLRDEIVSHIAHNPALAGLRGLNLAEAHLSDTALFTLLQSTHLRALRRLDLSATHLAHEQLLELFALELPQLEALALRGHRLKATTIEALDTGPISQALRQLDLTMCSIGAAGARALSPMLSRLEHLDLSYNRLDRDGISALVASASAGLRHLNVQTNMIGDVAIGELVDAPLASTLQVLRLDDNPIGAGGAQIIAQAQSLSMLRRLDLRRARLGDPGLIRLAHAEHLRGLRDVALADNSLGEAGLLSLSRGPLMLALRKLDLSLNFCSTLAVKTLLDAGMIRTLRLDGNPLGARVGDQLANLPSAAALQHLALADVGLGDDGLVALARAELPEIQTLELAGNHIGDRGLEALARAAYLGALHTLDLSSNVIADQGCAALAQRPSRALRELDLGYCSIGGPGAEALAQAPWLGQLTQLELRGNTISPAGAEALVRSELRDDLKKPWIRLDG